MIKLVSLVLATTIYLCASGMGVSEEVAARLIYRGGGEYISLIPSTTVVGVAGGEAPQGEEKEAPQGEGKEAPQGEGKEAPQATAPMLHPEQDDFNDCYKLKGVARNMCMAAY